jgi:hypothetical protein
MTPRIAQSRLPSYARQALSSKRQVRALVRWSAVSGYDSRSRFVLYARTNRVVQGRYLKDRGRDLIASQYTNWTTSRRARLRTFELSSSHVHDNCLEALAIMKMMPLDLTTSLLTKKGEESLEK